jgi:hypothetical protein
MVDVHMLVIEVQPHLLPQAVLTCFSMFDINFEICGIVIFFQFSEEKNIEKVKSLIPIGTTVKNDSPDYVFSIVWGTDAKTSTCRKFSVKEREEEVYGTNLSDDEVFQYLESQIKFLVSRFSPNHLAIHAGCVRFNNKTLLFPANGFRGKSTLTAEFVRLGAEFYSDDLAVFDIEGKIQPFSRKISMRDKVDNKTLYFPEELGGIQAKTSSRIDFVVFTEYKYKGIPWKPRRLSEVKGKIELLKHILTLKNNPYLSMEIVGKIAGNSIFLKGKRGEAVDFSTSVLRYLSR